MTSIVDSQISVPAGSTAIYTGKIVDESGNGIPAANLAAPLALSIIETGDGVIINAVDRVNILNTNRGTVDSQGNLTINLRAGDTAWLPAYPPSLASIKRSLVIDWIFNGGLSVGRHQFNFIVQSLAENP